MNKEHAVERQMRKTTQRACDICRRRKLRCDGVRSLGTKCSRCMTDRLECTYSEEPKTRSYAISYVLGLEDKIAKLEKLVQRLCPDKLFYNAAMSTLDTKVVGDQLLSPFSEKESESTTTEIPQSLTPVTNAIDVSNSTDSLVDDEDERSALALSERAKSLNINENCGFHGKSSNVSLFQRIFDARRAFFGVESTQPALDMTPNQVSEHEWEKKSFQMDSSLSFDFPDNDLLSNLVSLYFDRVNLYLPLFHRPRFEKSISDNLQQKNTSFGLLVLLVCAVASRFSDDARTRIDAKDPHSAGWKWFNQALSVHKALLSPVTLCDVQFYPLAVQFISVSSDPHSCWSLIGMGLRVATFLGIHRRGLPKLPSPEIELEKRAFWTLIIMDRMFSTQFGLPCAIHDEDFDLDLPIDCDDEYWDHDDPAKRFIQPKETPSKIACFISFIKLNRIVSVTLRTIYATNKSKVLFGVAGMRWQEPIVAELDSALNAWMNNLPSHLLWDPAQLNEDFYHQSLMLHTHFYLTQITVHRNFIPTVTSPSPLPFPSTTICANAARSCSQILCLAKGRKRIPSLMIHGPAWVAALVLILNLWSNRVAGQDAAKRDTEDLNRCKRSFEVFQDESSLSGRFLNVLNLLSELGENYARNSIFNPTRKRVRPVGSIDISGCEPVDALSREPRKIAGTSRVSQSQKQHGQGAVTDSTFPQQSILTDINWMNPVDPSSNSLLVAPKGYDEPSRLPDPFNPVALDPSRITNANVPHSNVSSFPSGPSINLSTNHPTHNQSTWAPQTGMPNTSSEFSMMATTYPFTFDVSAMGSTMFNMNESAAIFGIHGPTTTDGFSVPPANNLNAVEHYPTETVPPPSLMGRSTADFNFDTHPLSHDFDSRVGSMINVDSDMVDPMAPPWLQSPTRILLQEFEPFFSQMDEWSSSESTNTPPTV